MLKGIPFKSGECRMHNFYTTNEKEWDAHRKLPHIMEVKELPLSDTAHQNNILKYMEFDEK